MAVVSAKLCLIFLKLMHCLTSCRYDCIENELLGSLQFGIHNIAPYQSKGIEKATELSVCWNPKAENTGKRLTPDYSPNGMLCGLCFLLLGCSLLIRGVEFWNSLCSWEVLH